MTDGTGWDDASQFFADVHRMLTRLAGRVPDEMLTRLRELFGSGDLRYLPDAVSVAAVELDVPLTPADRDLLAHILDVLDVPGGKPQLFDRVPVAADPSAVGPFRFLPVRPAVLVEAGPRVPPRLDLTGGDPDDLTDLPPELRSLADLANRLTDSSDDTAMVTLTIEPGVMGVWRAWRVGTDHDATGRPVYLAEVAPGVPAWDLAYDTQRSLAEDGDPAPQVEVWWTGDALPAYHRLALAGAALLWTPEAGRARVALGEEQLADLVRAAAPRVPVPERRMLAERLAGGAAVPGRAERLPDLVEPGRGEVVPGGYRTDGRWVWPEALGYYLTEYGVAPPRELTEALAAGGATTPASQVAAFRASLALSGR
ncbi:hypothetical protein FXF53_23290 [Micromonospora sp. WP24]|uniref:hypothetical protein n=1 Tax=Micromonospora sp. WP24 TaxID=2604469 RepID=UPI0011D8FFAC|nr:hypothetical protein [Micromonospora sp. WP24]TYB95960.1 hypothetical protein FXF53_23290 [Micromonospora sp. WP24]